MATPAKAAEKTEDKKGSGAPDPAAEEAVGPAKELLKEEWAQGFRGTEADPTPNDHYTVAGVTDPAKNVPEEFKTRTGQVVLPDPNFGQK